MKTDNQELIDAGVLWAITAVTNGMDFQEAIERGANIYEADPVLIHERVEEIIDLYHEGYEAITGRK